MVADRRKQPAHRRPGGAPARQQRLDHHGPHRGPGLNEHRPRNRRTVRRGDHHRHQRGQSDRDGHRHPERDQQRHARRPQPGQRRQQVLARSPSRAAPAQSRQTSTRSPSRPTTASPARPPHDRGHQLSRPDRDPQYGVCDSEPPTLTTAQLQQVGNDLLQFYKDESPTAPPPPAPTSSRLTSPRSTSRSRNLGSCWANA